MNNLEELIKIRKATSGSEKSKSIVSNYIREMRDKIDRANRMNSEDRRKELVRMMNEEDQKRKNVLRSGTSSFSDPEWAGPSAAQSWIFCLLSEDQNEIEKAEQIINELMNEERPVESRRTNFVGYFIILLLCPLAYYLFNWWIALIVFIIGAATIGWKNRYD